MALFAVDVANRLADSTVLVHLVSIVANANVRFFTGSVNAVGTNRFANVISCLGARIIDETQARVGFDALAIDAIRIANWFAIARIGHSVVLATNLLLAIGGIILFLVIPSYFCLVKYSPFADPVRLLVWNVTARRVTENVRLVSRPKRNGISDRSRP